MKIKDKHLYSCIINCKCPVSVSHHLVTDQIQTELVSELTKLFGHALSLHPDHKRGTFSDALSSIGQGLAHFFQPHVQAVQQVRI